MTDTSLPPLADGDWPAQKPVGFAAARIALLFLAVVNSAGVAFRGYQALTVVRGDRLLDFLWTFVAYPASLAALTMLAISWVRRERVAGAVLASALLAFHGVRTVLDALAHHGDYSSAASRVAGQAFTGSIGVVFLWCAVTFVSAARIFQRQGRTATART
jgi:hypothetical protein